MKHNDLQERNLNAIPREALENLFNVYKTKQGDYFYNMMRTVQLVGLDNIDSAYFAVHVYREGEQWATISYKYYGTTVLWWLIAKLNGYSDPFSMPAAGTKLALLKPEHARGILSMMNQG